MLGQTLPDGFVIEQVLVDADFEFPVGMVHAEGVSYVWDLNGLVWPIVDGAKTDEPLIDISDEVGRWGDHGLLSVELHPEFEANGWIYLLYVVDRYHLYHSASQDYDIEENLFNQATIGRVVRYTVDLADRSSLLSSERLILIGESPEDGIPVPTYGHGLGDLCFGNDNSLLISIGDSNAPGTDYNGTGEPPVSAYDNQALADGILKPGENVGAFRSQYLNSLCGKIIRINPESGEAYPSNPFYEETRADEPISKVYALGFRNAYRLNVVPGTGKADPSLGNPGHIMAADVGDWTWEEINVVTSPGQNFGWPIFQGPEYYYLFEQNYTADPESPIENPCDGFSHYRFQDLIVQPRLDHDETWDNPCGGSLPTSANRFVHSRPIFSCANNLITEGVFAPEDSSVVPTFDAAGESTFTGVMNLEPEIAGAAEFTAISGATGMFLKAEHFPEQFGSIYLQADLSGWVRAFRFDPDYGLTEMQHWMSDAGFITDISYNQRDQGIYLLSTLPRAIYKLSFNGNRTPVINLGQDTLLGTSPLAVTWDASQSYDPDGDPIVFHWNFGDGTEAMGSKVSHTFLAQQGDPKSFVVELTVSDTAGNSALKSILVSLNNSFPLAEIIGFSSQYEYPVDEPSILILEADIYDKETPLGELTVQWDIYLRHNSHRHLEQTSSNQRDEVIVQPLGCGIETFWYEIGLSVTDPEGLVFRTSKEIYPDCDGDTGLTGNLRLYPNPAKDSFTLLYPSFPEGLVSIDFFDTSGSLSKHLVHAPLLGEISTEFRVYDLPPGLYHLKVRSANWEQTGKLMVVRE